MNAEIVIVAIFELLKVAGTLADAAGIPREALNLETYQETVDRLRSEGKIK